MNVKIEWKKLIVILAAPLAAGFLSALITKDNMVMFELVKKPPLAPPGWLFPVAWTVLYILMGLASYWLWISGAQPRVKKAGGIHTFGGRAVSQGRPQSRACHAAVSFVGRLCRLFEFRNLFAQLTCFINALLKCVDEYGGVEAVCHTVKAAGKAGRDAFDGACK